MALTIFQTVKAFAQFLNNWTAQGKPLLDQATADARAKICASCHNCIPMHEIKGGCSACRRGGSKLIEGIRSSIIGHRKTSSDAKLKACAICGCCLKMSVWMPNEVLVEKEHMNAYPQFCWKKAIEFGKEIL